jgi:glycosyltransferase involved in cell wall biosynthesis
MMRRQVLPRILPAATATAAPAPNAGVRIVGLLSSASGLGASARLCIEALELTKHPVSTCDVSKLFDSSDRVAFGSSESTDASASDVTIYHLNPPMLLPGILGSGLVRYRRSFNIGYWAWELDCLPREWIGGLRYVDAVFVPSTFCRDTVRRYTEKPVYVVPHPVREVAQGKRHRSAVFRVIGIFNFGSSFERKNPIALIRAFRAAFADDESAELVLKTSQGRRYPNDRDRLATAAMGMRNVRIIDEVWPDDRMLDLLGSADVYISLHRSEGFGLTIAEAIMREVPVVVTNWSGNTDFCPSEYAFTVDYDLIPFADGHTDYSEIKEAQWAEPSVAHAAMHLRTVRDAPDEARKRAGRLKMVLREHIGRSTYAEALDTLAKEFGGERSGAPSFVSGARSSEHAS